MEKKTYFYRLRRSILFDEESAFSGKLAQNAFLFHELFIYNTFARARVQFVINANSIIDAYPTMNVRTYAKSI